MPISYWIRSNDFLNIGSGFPGEKCFPFLLPFERAIGRMRRHHFLDFIWIYISTSWDFTAKAAVLCQLREDWNIKHHKNKNVNLNQIIFVKLCLFWRWGSFIEKELTEQNHILPSVTYLDLAKLIWRLFDSKLNEIFCRIRLDRNDRDCSFGVSNLGRITMNYRSGSNGDTWPIYWVW